nr:MAG TPA: hypothetical protein [Caudoviricetes sp.]
MLISSTHLTSSSNVIDIQYSMLPYSLSSTAIFLKHPMGS